jgi:Carbohydrate binding domain
MPIDLQSRLRRFSFAAICVVVIALYLQFTLRAYLASHFAGKLDSPKVRKAIQLEPANAEYRDLLGRNLALSGASLDEAISAYRTAVDLNPYEARYWLDLAGAYQIAGRTSEQADSVERAVQADPTTPHVAWEAANFFLVQGAPEKALPYFRIVLANDPEAVDSTLQLCWRATGDVNQILDEALPQRADLYLRFLTLLLNKQEVIPAERVWNQLIGLNQTFSAKLAFPYFQFLILKQEVQAAQVAWQQLVNIDTPLQAYLPSHYNLVVNGGFEENLLNGGFDWWYKLNPHAALALDTSEFHSGTRSLSVTFDGYSVAEVGLIQFIPVKPNTNYEFSAHCKTEDIESASGPRLEIADAYTDSSYVLTDDTLNTTPWRLHQARFQTGPNTNLVWVKIVRDPPQPLIRGKFWIDDVKLVETNN